MDDSMASVLTSNEATGLYQELSENLGNVNSYVAVKFNKGVRKHSPCEIGLLK